MRPVSLRWRLALTSGAVFGLLAASILAVNYALVRGGLRPSIERAVERRVPPPGATAQPSVGEVAPAAVAETATQATVDRLLVASGGALVAGVALAVGAGWLVAGRTVRPIRRVRDAARRLSGETLHERIRLDGPNDELKELADTLDGMLERLDVTLGEYRRFAANASHELRTPLTVVRTAMEVLEAKQRPTAADVEAATAKVRGAVQRSDAIIEGLMRLARSSTIERRETVDLAAVCRRLAPGRALLQLAPAWVSGDPLLLEQLILNLLENASRYSPPDGQIIITTGANFLQVDSDGPAVDPASVASLFEPFRRAAARTGDGGAGLGLSIVSSIARAHGARASASARAEGGLSVRVEFPG